MSHETRLTSKNFQDMSQDSELDHNRKFLTEYITYRLHPLRSASDCEAHDALFAKRGIENSFWAELGSEIHTAPEDTSEGDILAKDQSALIGAERMLEGGIDSLEEVLTGEGGRPGIGRVGAEGGWTMMEERMREVVYWNV